MTLTITNTTQIVTINGIPARVWEGVSENGIRVQCLITRIAVHNNDDCAQFEKELTEQAAPRSEDRPDAFPLRMVL
jgi:hypothetical protein